MGHMVIAAAILWNATAGTYHPILYRDAPWPGGVEGPRRLRSIGHHTTGFPTLDEAKDYLTTNEQFVGAVFDLENIREWDGAEVPADTAFLCGNVLT